MAGWEFLSLILDDIPAGLPQSSASKEKKNDLQEGGLPIYLDILFKERKKD